MFLFISRTGFPELSSSDGRKQCYSTAARNSDPRDEGESGKAISRQLAGAAPTVMKPNEIRRRRKL